MKKNIKVLLLACLALVLAMPVFAGGGGESSGATGAAPAKITIVGGTMLPEGHVYHRTVIKFADQMKVNYKGPVQIDFSIHHSATLGTEKDAVEFMIQGTAVDTYVVSPSWISTWDKTTPIIDAPFVFRDINHWYKALEQKAFQPIEDLMITKGLRIIGYGGGSTRNMISKIPAYSIADFPKIKMRVQGSPVHQRAFSATGLMATPLDYTEVYNAIKTGVLDAMENEPAGLLSMKFYEVAPYLMLTNHQIQTRILGFSEKRFQSFPKDVQDAIIKSGAEASAYHREAEISEAQGQIEEMRDKFGLTVIPFDNTEMRAKAMPAVEAYAQEIGAGDLLKAILNVK